MIKALLTHGHLFRDLNRTNVTLISKKDNSRRLMIIGLLVFAMYFINLFQIY